MGKYMENLKTFSRNNFSRCKGARGATLRRAPKGLASALLTRQWAVLLPYFSNPGCVLGKRRTMVSHEIIPGFTQKLVSGRLNMQLELN